MVHVMTETKTARLLLEVVAGVIPQKPEPELTKQWAVSSEDWHKAGEIDGAQSALLADYNGRAQGYAGLLMLQPDKINWVQTTWLWL